MQLRLHHAFFGLLASIWIGSPLLTYIKAESQQPAKAAEPMITLTSGGVSITQSVSSLEKQITPDVVARIKQQRQIEATEQARFSAYVHKVIQKNIDDQDAEIKARAEEQAQKEDALEKARLQQESITQEIYQQHTKETELGFLEKVVPLSDAEMCPGYVGSDANEVVEGADNPDHLTKAQLYAERC